MKFKYCPICGDELIEKYSWDEGGVPYCKKDDIMFFDVARPCVVVAVIKGDEVLLLKQSYIFKNSKVLISGYVSNGEAVEETVFREVFEETGLSVKDIGYLGSQSIKSKELIMLTFVATYSHGELKKSSEVEALGWIKLNEALEEMQEDTVGKEVIKKILSI